MSQNQAYLFYVFLLTGILIGLLFDIFRIFRKCFKHSNTITLIQDMFFFILTSILVLFVIFKFNNGMFRSYVIVGIFAGLLIYFIIFSKTFIKINVKIINIFKRALVFIISIIIYPFKLLNKVLKRTLLKPISFIFINIKKSCKNTFNKILRQLKIEKKVKKSIN